MRGGRFMRVVVVRHHEEDSAGFIGAAFEERGAEFSVHLFPKDGPLPGLDGIDHVVVLGALCSVYDDGPARAWIDAGLIPPGPWLEFHGDRCHLPPQARLLASNDMGAQAFSLGRHLGVQFHPEVDGAQLRLWLEAGGREEAEREGRDVDRLLAETIAEEDAARDRAGRLVDAALRIARTG